MQRLLKFAMLSCLALVTIQLAGCGGSDDSGDDSANEAADSGASGGAESGEGGGGESSGQMSESLALPDGGGGNQDNAMAMSGGGPGMSGPGGYSESEMGMSGEGGYPGGEMGMSGEGGYGEGGYGEGEYGEGGYGQGYPGAGGGQMAGQPGRPQDIRTWTNEHILAAVKERDGRVVQAIQAKASTSAGDPAFPELMAQVLTVANGGEASSAAGGAGIGSGLPFNFGNLFGGGSSQKPAPAPPAAQPRQRPKGSKPPGGASLDPSQLKQLRGPRAVDSLEVMVGQAILTSMPQAAQGTRNAAGNLQNAVAGQNPGAQAGAGQPGGIMSEGAGVFPGPPGSPAAGAPGQQGPGAGYPGAGYPGAGYPGANGGEMGEYGEGEMSGYGEGGGAYGQTGTTTGTLSNRQLVEAVVDGLILNNTPQAWQMLQGIADGSTSTPVPAPEGFEIVLTRVFSAAQPNAPVAETLLSTAVDKALADPAQNGQTLRLLAAISLRPADHYLNLSDPRANSRRPAGPGLMSGQPGAMGMQGPPGAGQMQAGAPGIPGGGGYPGAGYPGAAQQQMQMQAGAPGIPGGGGYPGAGYPGAGQMQAGVPGIPGGGGYPGGAGGEGEEFGEEGMSGGYGGQPGMGGQFGTQPVMQVAAIQPINVAEALYPVVARVLWAPSTVSALASSLQAESSLQTAQDLLALAVTVPRDEVRRAIYDLCSRTHKQGPGPLVTSGILRSYARDPGVLTVLKTLPRQKPRPANSRQPAVPNPVDGWVSATQEVVLNLRDRLRGAAENPSLAFDGNGPVRLHKDAQAERSIRIEVPGPGAQSLGDVAPSKTVIYYSRVTVVPRNAREMQAVVDHYEKRTKAFRREDRARGILWYDAARLNSDGTRQSMDVVIQQQGGSPPPGAGGGFQGEGGFGGEGPGFGGEGYGGPGAGGPQGAGGAARFVIDIIVVQTNDPAAEKSDQDDASTALRN